MSEGRQQEPRLSCEVEGMSAELLAADLTRAGLFVPTASMLRLEAELDVRLCSPIGEILLRGQVVQVISPERAKTEGRRAGCGLLFMDLEDDQRAWIGLTLDALARAAAKPAPSPLPSVPAKSAAKSVVTHVTVPVQPPSKSEPARPSLPISSTLRELEQQLVAVQHKSPWEVLGIDAADGPETAHEAFLESSKRYHPHAFARFDSADVSRAATELFIAHKRAYATISKGSLRPPKTPSITRAEAPPVTAPKTPSVTRAEAPLVAAAKTPSITRAAGATKPPKTPSITRAEGRATPSRQPEAGNDPNAALPPGKRQTAMALLVVQAALKHLAASRFDEAAEELERALQVYPESREAGLWLQVCRARKAKALGKAEDATRAYRALLELDPDHREAREYLGPPQRTGRMGKWFGNEER